MRIELEAYQVIEKEVRSSGNSGRVYVPKEWIGKRVKILLIDPLDEGNMLNNKSNQNIKG